jgi:hypothetical protein
MQENQELVPKEVLSENASRYIEKRELEGEVTPVKLYEGKRVEIKPGEGAKIIITGDLNGCTATAILTKDKDSKRSVQMVHFPPFMLNRHLNKIDGIATAEDRAAENQAALIYTSERRQENKEAIEAHLKKTFGEKIVVVHKTYPERTNDPENGILAVEIKDEEIPRFYLGKERI